MSQLIEKVEGISFTEYKVSGDLPYVLGMVQWIFEEYDPRAYGTRVHSVEHCANDDYAARISRANSAD
jgi:hypothetical protein